MISPDLSFAAMTRRDEPNSRTHTANSQNPSRAKRSWPARLGEVDRWTIALRYALGEKVVAIAATYQISVGYVTICAREFGVAARGHGGGTKPRQANPADEQHLRRWAKRKAETLRRHADAWEALADLE